MVTKSVIETLADTHFDATISHRRHIHKYPELSFKEYETSAYIQNTLTHMGIEFTTGYVETGIIALIKGKKPDSNCFALRADMDALPITENTGLPFESVK